MGVDYFLSNKKNYIFKKKFDLVPVFLTVLKEKYELNEIDR